MTTDKIICDDVIKWAASYKGSKFHALLCDPPYSLKFMGKDWDHDIAFHKETWKVLAKHLLPGAFGMVFASSRGWHRLACAIEDAGLIIHPSIFGWCYGSGFPKATRIDTQIDKVAGAKRKVVGKYVARGHSECSPTGDGRNMWAAGEVIDKPTDITAPATGLARAWESYRYGLQALKPALEPIIVFQKPYEGKPVECITETGAGALNIEQSRIGYSANDDPRIGKSYAMNPQNDDDMSTFFNKASREHLLLHKPQGRWPANFYLEHVPSHWICRNCGFESWLFHKPDELCPCCLRRVEWTYGQGCVYKGTKRVRGSHLDHECTKNSLVYGAYKTERRQGYANPDGKETVADWECVEECPVRRLGEQSGELCSGTNCTRRQEGHFLEHGGLGKAGDKQITYGDSGSPSRFFLNTDWQLEESDPVFYSAKASRGEREEGLRGQILCIRCQDIDSEFHIVYTKDKTSTVYLLTEAGHSGIPSLNEIKARKKERDYPWKLAKCIRNPHPTIKPLKLTQWLAALLLPPKEYAPRRILIPFSGALSEGIGAMLAGWEEMIAIEAEEEYVEIGKARMGHWAKKAHGRVHKKFSMDRLI